MDALPKIERRANGYLLVSMIGEPSNNELCVVVVEAAALETTESTEVADIHPVEPDPSRPAIELRWPRYVAYSVRNESYFQPEAGELIGKSPLGERTASAFLDYVAATTFADEHYPGPLRHWYLYTEWHCIDVVGTAPPLLRYLDPAETEQHILHGVHKGGRLGRRA